MKFKSHWILGGLVIAGGLLGLTSCSTTPSNRSSTTVHVGVGFRHPYYYGPGWGYRPYPPPPPRPPVRPPAQRPPPVHLPANPPNRPIGPTPRPPTARPRGGDPN